MATGITESPARIVRQLLVDIGQCILPKAASNDYWQASVNVEPVAPDNVVTIYNTGAVEDSGVNFDGTRVEHPTLQVRLRSTKDDVGYPKMRTICVALDSVYRRVVTVNEVDFLVQRIKRATDVLFIGYDEPTSKRWVYTFNLSFTVGLNPA